jgi:hypothetical protein
LLRCAAYAEILPVNAVMMVANLTPDAQESRGTMTFERVYERESVKNRKSEHISNLANCVQIICAWLIFAFKKKQKRHSAISAF